MAKYNSKVRVRSLNHKDSPRSPSWPPRKFYFIVGIPIFIALLFTFFIPGKVELLYASEVNYEIPHREYAKPIIYARSPDTVCYSITNDDERIKLSSTVFTEPVKVNDVTYYPIGYMTKLLEFNKLASGHLSCDTSEKIAYQHLFMGDLRRPVQWIYCGLGLLLAGVLIYTKLTKRL